MPQGHNRRMNLFAKQNTRPQGGGTRAKDLRIRFNGKITKDGDNCWIWNGQRVKNRYGRIKLIGGKRVMAHRLSWMLFVGPIPLGLRVCHHCDNPPCVNPSHLFLGTCKDNTQDMMKKGRNNPLHGESNPRAKLTAEQVVTIRRLVSNGEGQTVVARRFNVSSKTINHIVKRRGWKHLDNQTSGDSR